MSGSTNPFASLITNVSAQYGVPSNIALAVGQQESGLGTAGNYLMGVSTGPNAFSTDPNVQAQTGVGLLSQLYNQYGNWTDALSVYNSGNTTSAQGQNYASTVLGISNQNTIGGVANPGTGSASLTGGSMGYDPLTGLPTQIGNVGSGMTSPAGLAATTPDSLLHLPSGFFFRLGIAVVALILLMAGLYSLVTGKGTDTIIREQARRVLP
jgi:hypothetical protein